MPKERRGKPYIPVRPLISYAYSSKLVSLHLKGIYANVSLFVAHLYHISNHTILYSAENRATSPLFICLARILNSATNNNNNNTNINHNISNTNVCHKTAHTLFSKFLNQPNLRYNYLIILFP